MIKGMLVAGFLCISALLTAQTSQFSLDSVPKIASWQLTPNFSSLDSTKKLPSEDLKSFEGIRDLLSSRDLQNVNSQIVGTDGMIVYPATSEDKMKVVVPDTIVKQYLRIYGEKKEQKSPK